MSETNFTKLFSSITASTIWCESPETKVVWITMLAMADAAGFVYASVPGLANISQVPIDKTREALAKFLDTDPDSRDSENEGQRIEEIQGGWAILNHPKYRKIRSMEERRAYQREFMRKKRGKEKNVSSGVSNVSNCRPQLAQEEGEEEEEGRKRGKTFSPPTHNDVLARMDEMGYQHTDIDDFINFYECKNWMVGKNKMTKWEAALARWDSKNKKEGKPVPGNGIDWSKA